MSRVMSFFRLSDDNPFTGWHMLAVIGLFFGVVIGVNMVMAVVATGTFSGLVVKNSYVASQNYNDLLAAGEAQAERGWQADMSTREGVLHLRLSDSAGEPLTGLEVAARVGRPASAREDRVVAFRAAGDAYVASDTLAPGRWIVELTVRSGEALVYRATRPLTVRKGAS